MHACMHGRTQVAVLNQNSGVGKKQSTINMENFDISSTPIFHPLGLQSELWRTEIRDILKAL